MHKLNDAPILEQTEGKNETLLLAALWKLNGGAMVKLDGQDLKNFMDAHNNEPVLFLHGHADSIEVGCVTMERARKIAAHQAAITPKGAH